jgi:hypothetical protein
MMRIDAETVAEIDEIFGFGFGRGRGSGRGRFLTDAFFTYGHLA